MIIAVLELQLPPDEMDEGPESDGFGAKKTGLMKHELLEREESSS